VHVEPEFVALMKRLVPGCERTWEGATDQDLAALAEETLGEPPPFYQWFLRTMGRSMGTLAQRVQDMRISSILAAYRSSLVYPQLDDLLIACHPDEVAPRFTLYQLGVPTREDALVVSYPDGHPTQLRPDFETLREMLAWQLMLRFGVRPSPVVCDVKLSSESDSVAEQLMPVMNAAGFTSPIQTGLYCGLFESEDAMMIGHLTPRPGNERLLFCKLGTQSESAARQLLGRIGMETSLRVETSQWKRPDRS
jgi:hypothetical protein